MLKLLALILAHLVLLPPLMVAVATLARLDHRAADLLVQFSAPALIASLGLVGALFLLRLTPAALSGLVICGLLLAANAPQWWPPKGPAPAAAAPSISVYSANFWVYNQDMAAIARSIEAADADILILVELGEPARQQADTLFAAYPHRLYAGRGDHPAKSAIVSRYPLNPIDGPKHRETVAAIVQTPLGPISLIGAHLTRPWPFQPPHRQAEQVAALADLRASISGPLIMAGDFNAVAHGRIGRQVQSELGLIPAPAFPGTFPAKLPSPLGMTIDHVWHTPELTLTSRHLGVKNGSDHRPVITRLSRADPPRPLAALGGHIRESQRRSTRPQTP